VPIRFQVDSDFYDHPKALDLSDAAVALWTRAGSYSAAKLTDGFIPERALALLSKTPTEAADELRRCGLWHRVKGGFRFHQWEERNLTKQRVQADQTADRDRKRRAREEARKAAGQNKNGQAKDPIVRTESSRSPDGIQQESGRNPAVSVSVSVSESVSGSGRDESGSATTGPVALGPKPLAKCREHQDDPEPPACRRCKEAREAAEAWDLADGQRKRAAPDCPKHRGSPAHACGPCRSELLGAD
jgi:hypothetical protein